MPRRKYDKLGWPRAGTPAPYTPARRGAYKAEWMLSDQLLARAIVRHHGRLSYVAEELGCTVAYIRTRLRTHPELAQKVDDYVERLLDKTLKKAEEAVDFGNTAVILQLLKMLGSRRNLTERIVVEGGETPIRVENVTKVDLSNLTIEERRILLRAYRRVAPREGDAGYDPDAPSTAAVMGEDDDD